MYRDVWVCVFSKAEVSYDVATLHNEKEQAHSTAHNESLTAVHSERSHRSSLIRLEMVQDNVA